ncbi:MAG TPA: ATP-binding protein [Saprospiraceae bacterium]|nr:ATP-binding protein [Saprospiraceae bacterium]
MTNIGSNNITIFLFAFSIFKILFTVFLLVLLYRKHKKMQELLALRDQTYGILAHDLKSPYTAYFKIVERLRAAIKEGKVTYANEQLDHLENSFYATKNVLFNMMRWSQFTDKIETHVPEETNIKVFLTESTEHLSAYAKLNNIRLKINVEDSDDSLFIRKHYIAAVLRNLIDNIIKHDDCSEINICSRIDNRKLQILISHDGEGMPIQISKSLTEGERVQSLLKNYGDMGLGLSIIIKSLKKSAGTIQIAKHERGETISIIFCPG